MAETCSGTAHNTRHILFFSAIFDFLADSAVFPLWGLEFRGFLL